MRTGFPLGSLVEARGDEWALLEPSGSPDNPCRTDGGTSDAGREDARAEARDAGMDGGSVSDSGRTDAGPPDGGPDVSISDVDLGTGHSCALVDGDLWCWGRNTRGQIGVMNGGANVTSPTLVGGLAPGAVLDFSVGALHTCALISPSVVQCWGRGTDGQLGDGSLSDSTSPVTVVGLPGNVVEIAAGGFHTCARTSVGEMYCWGSNRSGQSGSAAAMPVEVNPTAVPELSMVRELAIGASVSCARSVGILSCWGFLGAATPDTTSPTTIGGIFEPVEVDHNSDHGCLLDSTGDIKCFGDDTFGQLTGMGSSDTAAIVIPGVRGSLAARAGVYHSCAIRADQTVVCWGRNSEGQLGDGTRSQRSTPAPVMGLGRVRELATGNASCAVTAGGELRCWGDNEFGQVGDGTTTDRDTPVTITIPP